jgi:hypothetical protein
MASILNADNGSVSGSAGLKSTADSSGVLALQTNGTTAVTISTGQVATFAQAPVLPAASIPQAALASGVAGTGASFSAYLNSTQSFTGGVWTKVQLNAEEWDTNSNFDSSTNYRFTPTVAGYYQVNCQAQPVSTFSGANSVSIYKNGSQYKSAYLSTYGIPTLSAMVYLNGSTDYIELYANLGTSQSMTASSVIVYMSGFLARAA